jgi:hypothetical protein
MFNKRERDMTVKAQHDSFIKTLKANCERIVDINTTVNDKYCESQITISLGYSWSGTYAGGHWGDCEITDDELQITFSVGDIYNNGDFYIGEGRVHLTYAADNEGMAYTGELDQYVGQVLRRVTDGMLDCSGSEQGMQGDDYLSVDIEDMRDAILDDRIVVQGSFA